MAKLNWCMWTLHCDYDISGVSRSLDISKKSGEGYPHSHPLGCPPFLFAVTNVSSTFLSFMLSGEVGFMLTLLVASGRTLVEIN